MSKELENKQAAAGAEEKNTGTETKETKASKEKKEPTSNKEATKEEKKPIVRTNKTVVEGNPIVNINGKEYEVKTPLFNVSGFGTFTNKEAATNEKLLSALLEMGSSVLKEVF